MSNFIPKAGTVKIGGLGRKAQKLAALREKAEQGKGGAKPMAPAQTGSMKAKDIATRKTSFQRKAV